MLFTVTNHWMPICQAHFSRVTFTVHAHMYTIMSTVAILCQWYHCFIASNYTIPVRLVDGNNDREGRVEALINGVWGTVCDPRFDRSDANVVCRQLGFSASSDVYTNSQFGGASATTPFVLGPPYCLGQELQLHDCYGALNRLSPSTSCSHNTDDVGVRCYGEGCDSVM